MTDQPDTTTEPTEAPTHCEGCEKPLLLVRPGRTHCEACRPAIRGMADIVAGRPSTIHEETTR